MSEQQKRKRSKSRKWLPVEEWKLLNYIRDLKIRGYDFENPTASIYYKKLIEKLQIENCEIKQIKNKVKNLKKPYTAVINWENQTGQGICHGQLRAMCPYYDLLHEIFGEKKNIILPYMVDTLDEDGDVNGNTLLASQDQNGEDTEHVYQDEEIVENFPLIEDVFDNGVSQEGNDANDDNYRECTEEHSYEEFCEYEQVTANDDVDDVAIIDDDQYLRSDDVHSHEMQNLGITIDTEPNKKKTTSSKRSLPSRETISRFKTPLSSIPPSINGFKLKKDRVASNAASVISNALIRRANAMTKKYRNEAVLKEKELQLKREQFEFDKRMRLREIKFHEKMEMLKLKKEERLAKYKIRLQLQQSRE